MQLKNITKESTSELRDIALSEFEKYFKKSVMYRDFNFLILPINEKYQYSLNQYLDLLEYYHISARLF